MLDHEGINASPPSLKNNSEAYCLSGLKRSVWIMWIKKMNIYIYVCVCVCVYIYNRIHTCLAKSCPTLCDPMDSSMPGLLVPYCLLEFAQAHVHGRGHNRILFGHKKNEILLSAATWIDLEIIILSKSEREREIPYH